MFSPRFITTALTAVALAVTAAGMTPEQIQQRTLPNERVIRWLFASNPATEWWVDSLSISSASAGYEFREEGRPMVEQLGSGHNLFSLGAESFMHLNSHDAVWGNARYRAGQLRNLRWTDCIDFQLIAPYVLGDDTGGDLATRRYDFGGGFGRVAGCWSFGGDVSYRAEIAHRSTDPRIKTVVSDLNLKVGVSRRVDVNYIVGADASVRVYSQNCDLDFYNPINDINTYPLTGLGSYYQRFMGNTNKNSGYRLTEWSVGVSLLPTTRTGWAVTADFLSYRAEQQLRNFNNIVLGYTDNTEADASVSYIVKLRWIRILPSIGARIFDRRGTENLFGTAAGASYNRIGSRRPYSHRVTTFRAGVPIEMQFGRNYLTISSSVTYCDSDEKYSTPARRLHAERLEYAIAVDLSLNPGRKWLADIRGEYTHMDAKAKSCILTGLDLQTPLGQCVVSNFGMLTTPSNSFSAGIGLSRNIDGKIISLSADGTLTRFANGILCRAVNTSISLTF